MRNATHYYADLVRRIRGWDFGGHPMTEKLFLEAANAIEQLMPLEAERLQELIRLNNEKANDECKKWNCNEMQRGTRCPNCPLDYVIHAQ